MININKKTVIKSCRPLLEKLYSKHRKKYIDLFFYERDLKFNKMDLSPLIEVGILKKVRHKVRANVQVFPLSGKFICTDFNYSKYQKVGNTYKTLKNGVWGTLPEESPLIAKTAIVRKGDFVLDLATGSGIIAIFCADKARRVIATDINPKAILYAKFNAILNDVENKIEFRVGDLFKPVKGLKFDFIIWNGPTVATPSVPQKYPIYAYGGMDGAEFTRRFINEAFDYLKPNGRLQWYDCAVGNQQLPVSMQYLQQKWQHKKIKVIFNSLTKTPVSLKKHFKIYAKWNLKRNDLKTPLAFKQITKKEYQDWHDWLQRNGYTHVYYGIVRVYPDDKFSLRMAFPKKEIRKDKYLTRYWLWMSYPTLLKRLLGCQNYSIKTLEF
ncbi:MAG: methyltransferase domain-containing protein [Bacteroidetes bacterium]|nr:MAG: methyltransferase domain-containing protein [Bacteroidota bacterium]